MDHKTEINHWLWFKKNFFERRIETKNKTDIGIKQ